MVFKDNLVARTFCVPLGWLSRFGGLIGLILVTCVILAATAARFYELSRKGDPGRADLLQSRIASLQEQLKQAQDNPAGQSASLPGPADSVGAPSRQSLLFSALPASTQAPPGDPKQVSIRLQNPKLTWIGQKLNVEFALAYSLEDGGSQQGRIIILARGPETLLAYPEASLNGAESGWLVAPEHGEYFSVSRYREVKAEFGPLENRSALRQVQALIFSQSGQLLIEQTLEPTQPTAEPTAPRPARTPKQESAP